MAFALGIVCIALLIWLPASFLGPKGQRRYLLALIVTLAVPCAAFAYGLDGYMGIAIVTVVAGMFLIANIPLK